MNYICNCPKSDFSKHNYTYWEDRDTTSDEIEIKDLTKATLRCYLLENEGSAKAVNNESVEGKKAIFSKAY